MEIHYGGFFLGSGNLRSYVDEMVSWFDNIEAGTWSPLWFSDFAEQLGYQNNLNLKIHWMLSGKIVPNGLRLILSDADTNVMTTCAEDVKNLVVYLIMRTCTMKLIGMILLQIMCLNCQRTSAQAKAVCREESYTKVAYFLHKFGQHKGGSSC